ncbi:MAG: HD domain-containing protein [Bacteroidia bacterium]
MKLTEVEKFAILKLNNELPKNLYYHSKEHVLDVMEAALMYAKAEKISPYETDLLKTAVYFHDLGFIVQIRDHENIGCEMAREVLPGFDYATDEIEKICGMIMATKIPQNPQNKLEEIIADADLDYLGRDDFWEIGLELYKELKEFGMVHDEKEWNQLQLTFLSKHHYFTETAKQKREKKKNEHTEHIRQLVKRYI